MLLHVLAARHGVERVAEIGTGTGVGTAWLATALPPGTPLFAAEPDALRARAAATIFAADPDVHVLEGDWRAVLPPHAPFDLVFVDFAGAKDDPDAVLAISAPGAAVVLDDFTADRAGPDERRRRWLEHPRLASVEVGTGGSASAIIATVRR